MKNRQVNKDLSPEESALIADIESIIAQLKQHEQAEGPEGGPPAPAEPEVNMDVITDGQPAGDEEQEETEEGKLKVAKDGATGSDTADQKINDLPVDDVEALKVVKAIMALGRGVNKSAAAPVSPTLRALQSVAKSLQAMEARIGQLEEFSVGMLEGMGVADALVQKSAAPQPRRRPVQSNGMDAQAFIDAIAAAVNKSGGPAAAEKPEGIRDALGYLTGSRQ
jgi:hypothetical protein